MAEYIECEVVVEKILRSALRKCYYGLNKEVSGLMEAKEIVQKTPAADVAPVVHAKWEEVVTHNGCTPDYDCVCSNCKESGLPTYKYCPMCGSMMRGEKNDN